MLDRGLKAAIGNRTQRAGIFWKVTGRLKVLNLEEMIARAPQDYDIYCDLRKAPLIGEVLGGNRWMDLRVFSFSASGYDTCLRGKYDSGCVLEKELFQVLTRRMHGHSCKIIPRFNVQPGLEGYCGLTNTSYQSFAYRMKGWVRQFSRVVLPQIWL